MHTYAYSRQKPAVALVAALGALITAFNFAGAQPLQPEVLFSFPAGLAHPNGYLVQGSDGNFYGTTDAGITSGNGTVFRLTTNGVLTTLVSSNRVNNVHGALTEGRDGNFYGTTGWGGNSDLGTVFRVTTNGVLTTLVSFARTNGAQPWAGLTLGSDGSFYGTTAAGGSNSNYGTVFRVTTNGVLTTLASFAGTNGWDPEAGLTLGSDGNFYGVTFEEGGNGTMFRVTTNGVLTTLVSFDGTNGATPCGGLTLGTDGNLYGTENGGGGNIFGTIFQVTTHGALTTLVSFDGTNGTGSWSLTLGSDGNFYGTTGGGGSTENGTVFQATTNGVLTTLVLFDGTNVADPNGGLTLGSDGNFYGTTYGRGSSGGGVIYRLRHGAYLQSFEMTTNGFQINTLNVGGSGWVVLESSSDLANWTPVQTNGTVAAQQFLDPTALADSRLR